MECITINLLKNEKWIVYLPGNAERSGGDNQVSIGRLPLQPIRWGNWEKCDRPKRKLSDFSWRLHLALRFWNQTYRKKKKRKRNRKHNKRLNFKTNWFRFLSYFFFFFKCLRRFHCRIELKSEQTKRMQMKGERQRKRERKNRRRVTKEDSVCLANLERKKTENGAYYVVWYIRYTAAAASAQAIVRNTSNKFEAEKESAKIMENEPN